MKYIITGSLGNISLPVTTKLIEAGHEVVVISSNADRKQDIEKLGATAAIGSVKDQAFLDQAFNGGDIAYLMIPNDFSIENYAAFQVQVADQYIQALQTSGIKKVVLLSSIGAHLRKGAGPIDALGYLEEQLATITDLQVKILRPSYFFNNLYSLAGMIKHAGIAGNNFGDTDEKLVLVDTDHIADVAFSSLTSPFTDVQSITYISNDERHPKEIASVLGAAVNKGNTPWITFSDEEAFEGMKQAGLNPGFAALYRDMGNAIRTGKLQEEYWKNKPEVKGNMKLEDFAVRFKQAYDATA